MLVVRWLAGAAAFAGTLTADKAALSDCSSVDRSDKNGHHVMSRVFINSPKSAGFPALFVVSVRSARLMCRNSVLQPHA